MDDGQSARPPRTARPRPRLAQPRAWSGWLFPGSAVTSSPSMPGSITWRRTRSGFPACTACSAVSPSAASTTANHPPRGSRTARSGYAVRRRRRVPGARSPHRQVTAGGRSRRSGRPGGLRRHLLAVLLHQLLPLSRRQVLPLGTLVAPLLHLRRVVVGAVLRITVAAHHLSGPTARAGGVRRRRRRATRTR